MVASRNRSTQYSVLSTQYSVLRLVLLTLLCFAPSSARCADKDYATVDPAELGIKAVTPKEDPKTGFLVGGKNTTERIKQLTELAGLSIDDLEQNMRPGSLSTAGFLGKDERLLDILALDNSYAVDELKLTHQQLARPLLVLGAVARRDAVEKPKEVTYRGRQFRIQATITQVSVKSPFEDDTTTNCVATVENLATRKKLTYSLLVPVMIERYGFYEGKGTRYRLDPRKIVEVFDFLREQPSRPNVLFLFADDQRADTIAALGNPIIKTPNLDRLAKRGLAFDCAYMQGGFHGATCVPSRAMLLSGESLFRIDEKLLRDETWPAAYGQAGYTTFMAGKWHNGPASIPASFQMARSVFAGGMTNPMKAPLSNLVDGKLTRPAIAPQHACAVFADEAIRFLKEPRDGPFFCYVAFDAPHDPHIVPDDFPVRYDAARMPLPPNFLPQHPWDNGEMTVRDEQLLPWPRPPEKVKEMNAEYYRYISYLDSQIGRILDALDASPYAGNTIVVFSADSGVARGSHGLIGKQNLYEHSVRVPLLIAGPGIPAGKRTEAFCYLFDVLPTLGKRCGVPAPRTSQGIDLTATLGDPAKPARPSLLFAYRDVQRAVREGRWKLIRYPQVDRTQLFDLETDPYETTNLADRPEQAARVAALTELLEKEQKQFGDKAPLKVANPKPAAWTPPVKH